MQQSQARDLAPEPAGDGRLQVIAGPQERPRRRQRQEFVVTPADAGVQ